MNAETDYVRLLRYARRHYQPTVRRAARSLGWTQARVERAVEDGPGDRVMLRSTRAGLVIRPVKSSTRRCKRISQTPRESTAR